MPSYFATQGAKNVTFKPVPTAAGPNSSRPNVYLFQPKLFYGWLGTWWNSTITVPQPSRPTWQESMSKLTPLRV